MQGVAKESGYTMLQPMLQEGDEQYPTLASRPPLHILEVELEAPLQAAVQPPTVRGLYRQYVLNRPTRPTLFCLLFRAEAEALLPSKPQSQLNTGTLMCRSKSSVSA